ncbi:MAG: fumarate/nitrate reduction transcriptional regulator Fnr [Gammaproteobacteria bacterium]|nr:fumarate/nitrate reduction transcriptional regulator Fnr [Gammaproteobacteria bacterium]MBU6509695.1 fumarate/nitrate reduction transcriptional regulator Fnr [Gammaproteobacteria bacterium]MDE1983387.1 fumarate/nitrate reduction transcriptional regulator Fnr [Gammaproteobacteria bacterium]MDE2108937.1 fumarate/nitrate reduction transcriptional regulator Fnr [Gammaproteobacteria bacterium]MDE2460611.1 fumarate/nitrate reduction transcriptional regulator Fnr [Gammaproteobacteria bacterium]
MSTLPADVSGRLREACAVCSLKELCLPRGLNGPDLERLDDLVERQGPFHEGDHLFRVGDRFQALFAVRAGSYKSYTVDSEGREHVLGFHLPGELLGLDAIYPGRHLCNALALDTATVCALPYEQLSDLAGRINGLRSQIMRLMSKDIADNATLAGDFTAEERLAAFLTGLSERFRQRGYSPTEFQLAMSRRDIANYLRLATETVSRVFARFEKDRLITVDRRAVHLLDLPRLRTLCAAMNDRQS